MTEGNIDIIDKLVSDKALASLTELYQKIKISFDKMEELIKKVGELNAELSRTGQSWSEYVKIVEKAEKISRDKQRIDREAIQTQQEIKSLIDDVIHSEKEHVKSSENQAKAAEKQTKANEKLKLSTAQLLKLAEQETKGINLSAFIKEDGNGLKNYSTAIQVLNEQIGRLTGLKEELAEKFREGAISESEYDKSVSGLSQRVKEYEQTLDSLNKKYEETGESQKIFNVSGEAFSNLSPEIQKMVVSLTEENETLNKIRQAQKELNEEYKKGIIEEDVYIQKKAQLNVLESDQANSVKKLSKELQLNQQITDSAIGSYEKISAQYSLLKIQINALGEAEGESAEEKRKLEAQAKSLYEEMNKLQKATGKATLQVGDYTMVNRELESAIGQINPEFGKLISGIKGATKASLAFIATPVGLILGAIAAALASVYSWFNRTEEGANALAVASEAFSTVLNQVLNVASQLGEILYKAFTEPKEAVKELGDFILIQLNNRFQALGKMTLAMAKIFSKDWKQGLVDFSEAAFQGYTGITGIGNSIKSSIEFQKELNDLETKSRNLMVDEAKKAAELANLKNIASDQSKTVEERQKALNKYVAIENGFSETKINLLKKEYELRKAQIELNKNGTDLSKSEKDELAKMQADIYKAEAENEQRLFAATRMNNQLRKEGMNDAKVQAELETFNYKKAADIQKQISEDEKLSFEDRRTAFRYYIDNSIAAIEEKAAIEMQAEGLTGKQRELIHEKSLYEIFKLEQKYTEGIKNLNIEEAKKQVDEVERIISEGSEEKNKLMQQELVLAAKVYSEQMQLNINNENAREKITEDYQKRRIDIIRKYNQIQFEEEIAHLQKLLDATDLSEKEKDEIRKKINALQKQNAKEGADYEIKNYEDKVGKMETLEEDFNKFMSDKRTQAVMGIWEQALDIANQYYEQQIRQIDDLEAREKESYDERLKNLQENIDAGTISEEEAALQRRTLEDEQLKSEKQYEEQRKAIQKYPRKRYLNTGKAQKATREARPLSATAESPKWSSCPPAGYGKPPQRILWSTFPKARIFCRISKRHS